MTEKMTDSLDQALVQRGLTSKAAKSLRAFSMELTNWIVEEAQRVSQDEFDNARITSDDVQRAIESLLCIPPSLKKTNYLEGIEDLTKFFFEQLHYADWRFVTNKDDVHVMRVPDSHNLITRFSPRFSFYFSSCTLS